MTVPWRKFLLPGLLIALLLAGVVWLSRAGLLTRIADKDGLVAWLRGGGSSGALLCITVQFLQVVIAVLPGEVTQFAAGYVFGAWRGFLYSLVGITLGSAFNFYFARVVGRPTLERLVGRDRLTRLDHAVSSARNKSALFLLFLLPGLPKDFLCYAAGLSGMAIPEFILISGLGRSPALLGSVLIGAGVSRGDYRSVVATGVVLLLAVGAFYWYTHSAPRH